MPDVALADTLNRLGGLGLDPPMPHLESMVAAQTGCTGVRVLTARLQEHPYARPSITTAGRHLVRGTAVDHTGAIRRFAFFVKVVRAWIASPLSVAVPEPLRSQLAPMLPWRIEPEVYRSGLGGHLPAGLRFPRVHHVAELGGERVALWLDEVAARPVRWDAVRHRHAAHLLGRLAARPDVAALTAALPPGRTARLFAEHWLGGVVIPDLLTDELWRRPLLASTYDADLRRRILDAVTALPALVDELESMPAATAHGDACPDNLLHTDLDDDVVLIDFGFWGIAPLGFDLGQLLLGEIQLGRRPAHALRELEQVCIPAYAAGLRDEGRSVPEHLVRRAGAITMTIFHAIPSIPYEHRAAHDEPELRPLFANRAAMARTILDLLHATGPSRDHHDARPRERSRPPSTAAPAVPPAAPGRSDSSARSASSAPPSRRQRTPATP